MSGYLAPMLAMYNINEITAHTETLRQITTRGCGLEEKSLILFRTDLEGDLTAERVVHAVHVFHLCCALAVLDLLRGGGHFEQGVEVKARVDRKRE